MAEAKTGSKIFLCRKVSHNFDFFYIVQITKSTELIPLSRFPPKVRKSISVGYPVKREYASRCGHKREPRESPTENGDTVTFQR